MCEQRGFCYQLRAEVDDMALMRLIARDSDGIALLPSVVVQVELRSGTMVEYGVALNTYENFCAITVQRSFGTPLLKLLLIRTEDQVLGDTVLGAGHLVIRQRHRARISAFEGGGQ